MIGRLPGILRLISSPRLFQFRKPKISRAEFWVILSGVLYGSLGYYGTELMRAGLSIPTILFWRFGIATFLLLFIIRYRGIRMRKGAMGLRLSSLVFCALLYAGSSAFYFMATTRIGTGLATVFLFLYPAFVMFLAWNIDKRPFTRITFITLTTLFCGVSLLNFNQRIQIDGTGIFLAILSAALYALYMFSGEKHVRHMNPIISTLSVCALSAITFLAVSIVGDSFQFPTGLKVWFYISVISIFCTCLPVLFLFEGLKFIDSGRAAILTTIEPVVTVSIGALLLGEVLSPYQLLGASVVLAGGILFQFQKISPLGEGSFEQGSSDDLPPQGEV